MLWQNNKDSTDTFEYRVVKLCRFIIYHNYQTFVLKIHRLQFLNCQSFRIANRLVLTFFTQFAIPIYKLIEHLNVLIHHCFISRTMVYACIFISFSNIYWKFA